MPLVIIEPRRSTLSYMNPWKPLAEPVLSEDMRAAYARAGPLLPQSPRGYTP